MREKKRYVVYEVIGGNNLKPEIIFQEIQKSCQEFMGSADLGKAGVQKINLWNSKKRRGIVKVNNKYVNHLKASLALVHKHNDEPIIIKSVGISGILKKAQTKFLS